MKAAADEIEHVLATKGELYLHPHQETLTWWQLSHLDIKLAAVVTWPKTGSRFFYIGNRGVMHGT